MSSTARKCPACCKTVVAFKKIKLSGKVWHKKCCCCTMCGLQLSTKSARVSSEKIYCIRHCPKPKPIVLDPSVNIAAQIETGPVGTFPQSLLRKRLTPNDKVHRTVTLRESCDDTRIGLCQITTASLTDTVADAIVNSISVSTDLSIGALSRAIARAGGPKIQAELDRKRRESSRPPTFGDVIVTPGGNLSCCYIFHTILRPWKDGQHVVQDLRQIVNKVFQLADENECDSLAIPPIGTGALGYPKHIVAQVLYAEAAEYLDNNPYSNIERIVFVINDEKDLEEIFRKLQIEEEEEEEEEDEEGVEEILYEALPSSEYDVVIPGMQTNADVYYETLDDQYSKSFKEPNAATLGRESSLQTFIYPKNWVLTKTSDKPYELVELDTTSDDYRTVVAVIVAADGEHYEKFIAKIQRVENGRCYELYEYLKRMMIKTNSDDVMNERHLFHGTSASAKDNIIATGFNRNYASANASYGKGVYFATNFSYSAQFQYSPPEREHGLKHIFLCRVLTGMSCLGQRNLLEPDYLPSRSRQYDSAVDNLQDPKIFVVFKDYVAYPEYLVTFYEDSSEYANL